MSNLNVSKKPNRVALNLAASLLLITQAALLVSDEIPEGSIKGIPVRNPETPENIIDLSQYYNGSLSEGWLPSSGAGTTAQKALPIPLGVGNFGGIAFDVRGVIQISGKRLEAAGGDFPESVREIKIGLKFTSIHFLHAAGWGDNVKRGTEVGTLVFNYKDGKQETMPIVTAITVFDWVMRYDNEGPNATRVWTGKTLNGLPINLFKSQWKNPYPDKEIVSMDYVSKNTDVSPFLLAISAVTK